MKYLFLACIFTTIFPPLPLFSQSKDKILLLDNEKFEHEQLIQYVSIYKDSIDEKEIEDLLTEKETLDFRPLDTYPELELNTTYWLRLTLDYIAIDDKDWVFCFGRQDKLELYIQEVGSHIIKESAGMLVPDSQKNVKEMKGVKSTNVIGFILNPGKRYDLYIRLKSNLNSPKLQLKIQNEREYKEEYYQYFYYNNLIQGFFQGVLIITLLYNIFLFFQNRNNSYLYYVVYLLTISLYLSNRHDYLHFLTAENPSVFYYIQAFSVSLLVLSYLQFMISFLRTGKNFRRWHILFQGLCILLGINAMRAFWMLSQGYSLDFISNVGNVLILLAVIPLFPFWYMLIRQKVRSAFYFVISSAILSLLGILYLFFYMYDTSLEEYLLQLGVVGQIIIMAAGASSRMRAEEKEKIRINEELKRQLIENEALQNKSNAVLENAILKRTLEIRQSKDRMQSLLDSNIQSYLLIDKNYRILIANRQARQYVKDIQGEELKENSNILDYLLNETERTAFIKHFKRALKGIRKTIDHSIKEKYVGAVWYNIQFLPAYNESGEIFAVSFSMLDITQRKKTQEKLNEKNLELRETNKKLSELNHIKDKMFSIISHDFRSPLASLKSTLFALKLELLTEEEKKSVFEDLDLKLDNTLDAMDNLLFWAKNQLEGSKVNPTSLNLRAFIEMSVDLLRPIAEEKNIHLNFEVDSKYYATADMAMFRTIMRNLLSNAIKFSYPGKDVRIKAGCYDKDKGFLLISIEDSGMGIPEKFQHKILDADYNYTSMGTEKERGTGLGLMICKDFVEKNGGKLWFESKEGEGSTFYFTIPKSN